jgi:hypothetical protein
MMNLDKIPKESIVIKKDGKAVFKNTKLMMCYIVVFNGLDALQVGGQGKALSANKP